ncbi:DUF4276 family protein [Myxococcota bacterium]|nr:DUF4276 family protein [Myxococcota bacterium]MBU1537309.1 DUF4276 family protein [Myxococcota bacterium]
MAVFLEERSAQALLEGLLPKILPPDVHTTFVVFEGKQDLEKQLVRKMRGWRVPDTCFVVLRDQDSGDCSVIKKRLQELCGEAKRPGALIRIACRELESWYLGDLAAVEQAFDLNGIAKKQGTKKFRNPDSLGSPSKELIVLTKHKYQKIAGSRTLGPLLSLDGQNQSVSFNIFLAGITRVLSSTCPPC